MSSERDEALQYISTITINHADANGKQANTTMSLLAEREQQRQLLEAADPPAVTSDQPDRGECDRIEGRRPR